MTFLEQLKWRQATKHFNPERKIDQESLDKILEAIRLAPTSHGLQAFHVYVVTDPKIKSQVRAAAFNQSQVSQASHLLVFCYRTDVAKRAQEYLDLAIKTQNLLDETKIENMKTRMLRAISLKNPEEINVWLIEQLYVVLSFALAACAELAIDSCPLEGFKTEDVDMALNLPANHKSILLLPIGYRSKETDWIKVRFDKEDLFTVV